MDVRSPTCGYPHCADYDNRCATGINIPCIVIDGENLERERRSASLPTARKYYALAVVVLVSALGAALYAANAAQGAPV